MNKGDTLRLNLNFTYDGEPLGNFDEMEFQLNKHNDPNAYTFKLSDNTIKYDVELERYYIELTQEQTFTLTNRTEYQLRVLKNGEVHSSDIGTFNVGNVLSASVLL